jgi:hypothetical protein
VRRRPARRRRYRWYLQRKNSQQAGLASESVDVSHPEQRDNRENLR